MDCSFKVKLRRVNIKVPLSCLLLVLDFCNVPSIFRKYILRNFFVISDFTLDCSFKVKLGQVRIKVSVSRLLVVLDVCNGYRCEPTLVSFSFYLYVYIFLFHFKSSVQQHVVREDEHAMLVAVIGLGIWLKRHHVCIYQNLYHKSHAT